MTILTKGEQFAELARIVRRKYSNCQLVLLFLMEPALTQGTLCYKPDYKVDTAEQQAPS